MISSEPVRPNEKYPAPTDRQNSGLSRAVFAIVLVSALIGAIFLLSINRPSEELTALSLTTNPPSKEPTTLSLTTNPPSKEPTTLSLTTNPPSKEPTTLSLTTNPPSKEPTTNRSVSATEGFPSSEVLETGTFRQFTGSNSRKLQYHFFDNGNNGTLFYFDGDQTTNFHYPLVDASIVHQPGVGNGHVQRMKQEAAERGMDLVFLEHPHGEDVPLDGPTQVRGTSWWDYMDDSPGGEVDEFAEVVREIIAASRARKVQLVGYSGGAEFLARHLLVQGNGWLPAESAVTFIGGGGAITGVYEPVPPAPGRKDMPYVYCVGLLDGTDPDSWSALESSRAAVQQWKTLGYRGAVLNEIPDVDHYDYDFQQIVGEQLDELLMR